MSKTTTKRPFSAIQMRLVLGILLFLILVGLIVGFYFAYTSLRSVATEVSATQTEAQDADTKLQHLMSLEDQLKKHSSTVDKAQQIVAQSQSYQYQNQILEDMKLVASRAGLGVTSITFQEATASGEASAGNTTAQANGSTPSGSTGGTNPSAAASIKSTNITVQLSGNPSYEQLLHFVYLIEQNVTRMQIASLSLSGSSGSSESGASGGSQTLNIEVYVR